MPGPGITFSDVKLHDTELKEADGSFRVEESCACSLVFGNAVSSLWGKRLRIFISASTWVGILRLDGHGAVNDWQLLAHGEHWSLVELGAIAFGSLVLTWSRHLEGIERNMSLIRKFLGDSKLTSLLKYRLKPLLDALFFSKTVLMSYLVAPGEAVRSSVKSLLFP